MSDLLTVEITHDERSILFVALNLYLDALRIIPANRESAAYHAAMDLHTKLAEAHKAQVERESCR